MRFLARLVSFPINPPAGEIRLISVSWMYGNDWPNNGEIDLYEEWNASPFNQFAFHTGNSAELGECTLDGFAQSGSVISAVCDASYTDECQYENQGCASTDVEGSCGSAEGGICKCAILKRAPRKH